MRYILDIGKLYITVADQAGPNMLPRSYPPPPPKIDYIFKFLVSIGKMPARSHRYHERVYLYSKNHIELSQPLLSGPWIDPAV